MKLTTITGLIAAIFITSAASAQTLIELPGTPDNASTISATQYNAFSFSFSQPFSSVSIEASLTSGTPATGTAYLTTAVGILATSADVVASEEFDFVVDPDIALGYVELFSGLTLPADDYFVVIGEPFSGVLNAGIELSSTESFMLAPGATVGNMLFATGGINSSFPPSSEWITSGLGNRYFRVTVPEPGSACLFALGLLGIARLRQRRFDIDGQSTRREQTVIDDVIGKARETPGLFCRFASSQRFLKHTLHA